MSAQRGAILGVVLSVITLALLLVVSIAGISTGHLNQAVVLRSHEQARALAEAVIAQALAKLHQDQTYGTHGTPDETIIVAGPNGEGQATLTFIQPTANSQHIPWSISNLNEEVNTTLGWNNHVIPQRTADLIGVGVVGGTQVRVEAMVYLPIFPFAVMTQSTADVSGLTMAGVGQNTNGVQEVQQNNLGPATLAANGDVTLGSSTSISGTVRTAGVVQPATGAYVSRILENEPALPIKAMDPSSFSPAGEQGVADYDPTVPPPLTGPVISNTSLVIPGVLQLDHGLLYVKGSVTLGGISGYGAVVATQGITVTGTGSLDAANDSALVAGGDVVLKAQGGPLNVQGIVYSGGDVRLDGAQVLGTVVGQTLHAVNSTVVAVPDLANFQLSTGQTTIMQENEEDKFIIGMNPALTPSQIQQLQTDLKAIQSGTDPQTLVPDLLAIQPFQFQVSDISVMPPKQIATFTSLQTMETYSGAWLLPADAADVFNWLKQVMVNPTSQNLMNLDLRSKVLSNWLPLQVLVWKDL